jgi:hypothetical protein
MATRNVVPLKLTGAEMIEYVAFVAPEIAVSFWNHWNALAPTWITSNVTGSRSNTVLLCGWRVSTTGPMTND